MIQDQYPCWAFKLTFSCNFFNFQFFQFSSKSCIKVTCFCRSFTITVFYYLFSIIIILFHHFSFSISTNFDHQPDHQNHNSCHIHFLFQPNTLIQIVVKLTIFFRKFYYQSSSFLPVIVKSLILPVVNIWCNLFKSSIFINRHHIAFSRRCLFYSTYLYKHFMHMCTWFLLYINGCQRF